MIDDRLLNEAIRGQEEVVQMVEVETVKKKNGSI